MIPVGDDNSKRTLKPYVNYLLIALNIFVFVILQKGGTDEHFTLQYALVPTEIITGRDVVFDGLGVTPIPYFLTIFTSIFLHGSWMHLGGNMLYLWIFGDNLENRMGHKGYLFFYLLCGLAAGLSHVAYTVILDKQMLVPCLGASGAIAGVMGGYLLIYPKNRVAVYVLFLGTFRIPAFLVLGIWIIFQLISGYQLLNTDMGGVAYAAHIGGFLFGMITARLFPIKNENYWR